MNITTELVVFIFMVLCGVAGAWWRVEAAIDKAKREAQLVANAAATRAELVHQQLSEFKTEVARTYVSKVGLAETTKQIMEALRGVKDSVDHLNDRLDRVIDKGR